LRNGLLDAYLLKGDADALAKKSKGAVKDFAGATLALQSTLSSTSEGRSHAARSRRSAMSFSRCLVAGVTIAMK
jgi:hypothetical protein